MLTDWRIVSTIVAAVSGPKYAACRLPVQYPNAVSPVVVETVSIPWERVAISAPEPEMEVARRAKAYARHCHNRKE